MDINFGRVVQATTIYVLLLTYDYCVFYIEFDFSSSPFLINNLNRAKCIYILSNNIHQVMHVDICVSVYNNNVSVCFSPYSFSVPFKLC